MEQCESVSGGMMAGAQLSMLDMIPAADERETVLRAAARRGIYADTRVRVFAMLSTGWFPQYAARWLAREYGSGGGTLHVPGDTRGWFLDYAGAGMRAYCFTTQTEYRYSWPEVLSCIRGLIDQGEYLDRADERIVERVMQEYGTLPYPRAAAQYPEGAWKTQPTEAEVKEMLR